MNSAFPVNICSSTSARPLDGFSAADLSPALRRRRPAHTQPPTLVRDANRPFGHQSRYTKRHGVVAACMCGAVMRLYVTTAVTAPFLLR